MAKRLIALALLFSATLHLSCKFAVKHPAATAGITAGSLAFATCELASEDIKKCSLAGGAVGLGLALVAGFALWLGSEDEPATTTTAEPPPKTDWSKIPDTTPKEPTKAPPPPGDAGVPMAPDASAPPPPPPSDAGVAPPGQPIDAAP